MKMATEKIPPAPRWDLDSIFPGGSESEQFTKHRKKVKANLDTAETLLIKLPGKITKDSVTAWADFVLKLQALDEDIELVMAFSGCLTSQDVDDAKAHAIEGEGDLYHSRWQKLRTGLEARSLDQTNDQWNMLLAEPTLKEIGFYLNELRTIAKSKMPIEMESLALDLAVNGYHAWNHLYDKMAGDIKVDFEEDGETKNLSMGQIATKLSDPNRTVRKYAFEKLTEGWKTRSDLAAMMLNSLSGFRLSLYDHRHWDSPMREALMLGRVQQKTLDAMWGVIKREAKRLGPYIEAKKKLLNIDKFSWYDQFAPCGKADKLYSFEEAGKFIIKQAAGFSTHMADFIEMALDKRWVEGEDRPNKRGGGFCTGMGPFKQSRIFMTYGGTFENLLTLAHELGHAYHSFVLKDKPPFAAGYPMNLAETASIFSETLVIDAALDQVTDPQEKLMLLEQKLQATYTMFCDIHCRYLFERDFYTERKMGVVPPTRLSELMLNAQKQAFGNLLDESGRHPLFWCSKLHFYISDVPFYNFPYTFGFLFAGGVYDRARKEGSSFADKYRALLADTGSMKSEDVAKKHLGIDLTEDEFWVNAVNRSLDDVDEFVKLAEG